MPAGPQMPAHLIIGATEAFANNSAYPYHKKQVGEETRYVCTKGSQWARTSEVLVLRCVHETWTAFDSAANADGSTLQRRQSVFRCLATDITQPGWHKWETNYAASPNDLKAGVIGTDSVIGFPLVPSWLCYVRRKATGD